VGRPSKEAAEIKRPHVTFGFPCPLKQLFDELLRDVQRNEFEDDICLVRMEIQRTGQTGYRVME